MAAYIKQNATLRWRFGELARQVFRSSAVAGEPFGDPGIAGGFERSVAEYLLIVSRRLAAASGTPGAPELLNYLSLNRTNHAHMAPLSPSQRTKP